MADADLTRNQKIVLSVLSDAGRPLGAYQILDDDKVREAGLKAPLSIYRALDKLIDLGLIHRVESLNAFVVCDHGNHSDPAAFMVCADCKQTIEFTAPSLQRAVARYAAEHDFSIGALHLEVSGQCEKCAEHEN